MDSNEGNLGVLLFRLNGKDVNHEHIQDAAKLIRVIEESEVFKTSIVKFEENKHLSDMLMSVNSAGSVHIDADNAGAHLQKLSCNNHVDSNVSGRTACRSVEECSWHSLSSLTASGSSVTLASVSDNGFYDDGLLWSGTYPKLTSPNTNKGKMLNTDHGENGLVRYVGEFESRCHRNACVIPDIVIMRDMKIVLIDHYHNSIQLFNEKYEFLDEKTCQYPMGLCVVSPQTVCVTLRRNSHLAFFDVKAKELVLKKTLIVQCKVYLWQVSFKADRLYFVCDENDIHVIDVNGTKYVDVHSGVPTECGYIRYFDVNDNGSRIYLSEKTGLRCINIEGKFQWHFGQEDFPENERDKEGYVTEGVCYYNGTILGTHWTRNKIFQISGEGKFVRNIVVDNLEHPRVMSIMGNKLAVAQFRPKSPAGNSRTIKVFEILKL